MKVKSIHLALILFLASTINYAPFSHAANAELSDEGSSRTIAKPSRARSRSLKSRRSLQEASNFEVEGPIQSIVNSGGGRGQINVMGVVVQIVPDTQITSPKKALTLTQLANPAPLPGRTQPGFVGGTAIIEGQVNAAGTITADTLFVEPAENVFFGPVTTQNTAGGAFDLVGKTVSIITDPRMPTGAVLNQFGFAVDPRSVPLGDLTSAEGYNGVDGRLYAHTVETEGGTLIDSTPPEVSIQRAQCRNRAGAGRDEAEVRGGVIINPATPGGTVTIQTLNAAGRVIQTLGSAAIAPDAEFPPFGTYRFRSSALTYRGDVCPTRIKAIYHGSTATADFVEE